MMKKNNYKQNLIWTTALGVINKLFLINYLRFRSNDFPSQKRITVNMWGENIILPLNHRLPLYSYLYKNYSTNLRRLSCYLGYRLGKFVAVDIGSNVGDSAILIRQGSGARIVCVEGDKKYVEILRSNLKDKEHIQIIQAFVGEKDTFIKGELVKVEGTGSIDTKNTNVKTRVSTLDKIISKLKINNIKLLKIDTDGFDGKVLRGARSTILRNKPVIFFEFDQGMYKKAGDSTYEVLKYLYKMNYHNFLVYDNFGKLIRGVVMEHFLNRKDFSKIFNHKDLNYYDLVAFHKVDTELYKYALRKEMEFYRR